MEVSYLHFFVLCLSTLFSLMNPIGITPIYVILTERFNAIDRIRIARRAMLTATITLIVFSLVGQFIFKMYSITIEAFQIMGGIIFFRSGLRMLEARVGRTRTTPKEQEESMERDDIAISPLGIPMIVGPGAITATMLLSGQAHGLIGYGTFFIALFTVLAAAYLILRGGDRMSKRLGHTGMRIIQRIMGIILMVIAVQFIINGSTTVLKSIL